MTEQQGIDLFALIAGLILAYLASLQAFFSAAKTDDAVLFKELGSPHLFLNNKPIHTALVVKALFTLKHTHSTSSRVKLWGNLSLALFVAVTVCFVVYFYANAGS